MAAQHPKNTLITMSQELPQVNQGLALSLEQIAAEKVRLQEQKDALEDQVMAAMVSASTIWIINKKNSLNPTWSYAISGTYGVDNVTDWGIFDPSKRKSDPLYNRYLDTQVTSGSPALPETQQYNRQIEFPIVYDQIHHVSGMDGTYGIDDAISSLDDGATVTVANAAQSNKVLKIANRYSGY